MSAGIWLVALGRVVAYIGADDEYPVTFIAGMAFVFIGLYIGEQL